MVDVGTKSITTGCGVFLEEVCVATAESVNVFFDLERRRSLPLTDALRSALEASRLET